MQRKKILKFFIAGSVLGLVVIFIYIFVGGNFLSNRKSIPFPTPIFFPTISPSSNESVITPTIKLPPIRGGKLVISGVEVEDFLESPVKVNQSGDVLIVESREYQMLYFPQEQEFLISVVDSPFEEARKKAEQEFLEKLGVGKEDACGLDVVITTPYFVNPDFAGKTYALSFCEL